MQVVINCVNWLPLTLNECVLPSSIIIIETNIIDETFFVIFISTISIIIEKLERMLDFYIHWMMNIAKIQFSVVTGRGTADPIFVVRQPQKQYRQVSNIRRTKSQHSKDSPTVLQLSLQNPLKPYVKSRMKM